MMPVYENFCWYKAAEKGKPGESPEERYRQLADWAGHARGTNPKAFDGVTAWLRNSGEWGANDFSENRKIFMNGIIGRFSEQNRLLEAELRELEPFGVVNPAVWGAIRRFNEELSGQTRAMDLQKAVTKVFQDFSSLKNDDVRKAFAGEATGPAGTDTVNIYGYINMLKDCDAAVQWTLFMPDFAKRQQKGFWVESFAYMKLPALRFIGIGRGPSQQAPDLERLAQVLDAMKDCRSGFDYDLLLVHHFGKGVDVQPCHPVWGRFMKAGTPVPAGFEAVDFLPQSDGKTGPPYLSRFAFAKFAGEAESMHSRQGFDCDAMYDVTRNIILGENVLIPYPDKYWTAEAFLSGFGKSSCACLFSIDR